MFKKLALHNYVQICFNKTQEKNSGVSIHWLLSSFSLDQIAEPIHIAIPRTIQPAWLKSINQKCF